MPVTRRHTKSFASMSEHLGLNLLLHTMLYGVEHVPIGDPFLFKMQNVPAFYSRSVRTVDVHPVLYAFISVTLYRK